MKMHADHVTLETTEKRKRNVDDVQKRKEYRIAHGLEEPDGTEREAQEKKAAVEGEVVAAVATAGAQDGGKLGEHEDGTYVDWEGKRKPVKKWLGIW